MALLSENHHRIEVRVAKIKEMKEKWGPSVGNIVYMYIKDGVGGRGIEKACNLGSATR